MSFQTKLKTISDALTSIAGLNVYHYWRFGVDAPYCIWQEDGETSFEANNHKAEQGITGSVDYFTLTEYDGKPVIAEAFAAIGISNTSVSAGAVHFAQDTANA